MTGGVSFLLMMILVLVGVAFLTLLERKVLGYIQIRKGPNKVGVIGILQAFSDAIKLFTKEMTYPNKSNYLMYYFCPLISFLLIFIIWSVTPFLYVMMNFNFGFLFFMMCLSMGVYGIMVAGWSSNSSYSLLGGLRAVAQTISYEVSLGFLMMNMLILCGSYSFMDFFFGQYYCWFVFTSFPLFFLLFTSMLAETNRTPFDFAEGESELVSGFNIEYSSGGFALIFLAEYSSILLMSLVLVLMYLGGDTTGMLFFFLVSFISFSFIWARGTLPRYRYDKLMNVCWKSFLPVSLLYLVFYFSLKIFITLMVF
uniref:NADH-ubiquinone oxidoreductase chain 1 n=1 Tax=Psococerastis albimaculata TaxID=1264641 RepID=M9P410_9NEOP|nr:NADH dehydrogenase subunit 1 [Psococerastis albimaculata]AFY16896.1 NADH dehydrogenase subunit 1 [Psococerastis albimaculata]